MFSLKIYWASFLAFVFSLNTFGGTYWKIQRCWIAVSQVPMKVEFCRVLQVISRSGCCTWLSAPSLKYIHICERKWVGSEQTQTLVFLGNFQFYTIAHIMKILRNIFLEPITFVLSPQPTPEMGQILEVYVWHEGGHNWSYKVTSIRKIGHHRADRSGPGEPFLEAQSPSEGIHQRKVTRLLLKEELKGLRLVAGEV